MTGHLAAWVEIDLGAVARNARRLKNLLRPPAALLAVVKADAYGHGAVPVAKAAITGGASWLGVARVQEGAALRDAGIKTPILLLAEPAAEAIDDAVALALTPTLYTKQAALAFSQSALKHDTAVGAHLKVDTGMHRYGVHPDQAPRFFDMVSDLPGLSVSGIWSHFAVAEDVLNAFTKQQFEIFSDVLDALGPRAEGLTRHLANSAGAITFPESHLDMVRSGIAVYGIHPAPMLIDRIELEPAMTLKTRVGLVKRVPAGEALSYGQRYTMSQEGYVATAPCGYADGLRRGLSNNGEVLIRGRRYPICGAVTMDHFLIDAGLDRLEAGEEIVIIGEQQGDRITAQQVADRLQTIPYEVVCGISSRVPRIYK